MNLKLKDEIDFSKTEGIGTLTMRRGPLNVLNIAMMSEFNKVLVDPETIKGISVLVLKAEGKAFCAGVDVADHTSERTEEMLTVFHSLIKHLKQVPVPTVAFVEGAALGGGFELVLACDMVLASEKAKFGTPEITLAVFPPVAMVILPQLIGMKKTMELVLSGKTISASAAEQLGLINGVYAADEFSQKAGEFLARFTKLSRSSLKLSKEILMESTRYSNQDEALQYVEGEYLKRLMLTPDAQEGIAAFLEKREPVWSKCCCKEQS